jgi:hypothetical protein
VEWVDGAGRCEASKRDEERGEEQMRTGREGRKVRMMLVVAVVRREHVWRVAGGVGGRWAGRRAGRWALAEGVVGGGWGRGG